MLVFGVFREKSDTSLLVAWWSLTRDKIHQHYEFLLPLLQTTIVPVTRRYSLQPEHRRDHTLQYSAALSLLKSSNWTAVPTHGKVFVEFKSLASLLLLYFRLSIIILYVLNEELIVLTLSSDFTTFIPTKHLPAPF